MIENVILNNSADWTLHFLGCSNIVVFNYMSLGMYFIKISFRLNWPNNDGIDIDSTSHVRVVNSVFSQGDDGVCLKSTKGIY